MVARIIRTRMAPITDMMTRETPLVIPVEVSAGVVGFRVVVWVPLAVEICVADCLTKRDFT
jgi:hypothetical protein